MSLRETREQIVREHMESENRHEFDVTMATFHHPRYEIIPTGEVYDGPEEVQRYFDESRTAFPDQRNELIALHHAEDAVIAEFWREGPAQPVEKGRGHGPGHRSSGAPLKSSAFWPASASPAPGISGVNCG